MVEELLIEICVCLCAELTISFSRLLISVVEEALQKPHGLQPSWLTERVLAVLAHKKGISSIQAGRIRDLRCSPLVGIRSLQLRIGLFVYCLARLEDD